MYRFFIKGNELCPCGSGKIYKECCKGKPCKKNISKKPKEVQIMEKMRSSMEKCCMYPDKNNCKGKIKDAHALQNKKIISLLAGSEHHVYMLNTKGRTKLLELEDGEVIPIIEVQKIGVNHATTETCFCDLHDDIAFATIEKGSPNFDETNEEMKFIYAYKAFIFEYYKKQVSYNIFKSCFKENPQVFTLPQMVTRYRILQQDMKYFDVVKSYFDSHILKSDYKGIVTCIIKIPKQIKFANYAYIALNYDMNGKKIKNTIDKMTHRVLITIFPEENQSYILLSCLDKEKNIYKELFEQLKGASINEIEYYFNLILPLYSENIVLSPLLWNSWNQDIKNAYTHFANLSDIHAARIDCYIRFGLKNNKRKKNRDLLKSKIDLFL